MYRKDSDHKNCICYASIICFYITLGLPFGVHAQTWQFEPVVKLAAEYNDNVDFTSDELSEVDSTAFTVDAKGQFVRRSAAGIFRISPRVRSKAYSENSLVDTTDVFFGVLAGKTLERTAYGLQARFAQEDVLTAELDDPDFDNPDVENPINLDTGRVRVGTERETVIVSPYFRHDWTETLAFGINANYVDASYEENQLNLTDYTNALIGTELNFRVSQRTILSLGMYGRDYEAEDGANRSESQSIGADLEFRHDFSATMQGRIGVGYEDVDSEVTSNGFTISESNGVTVFSAGITKTGDISRLVLEANQKVDPGGTGFLQERTQLRIRYTRELSPRMSGSLNARIQSTKELSPELIEQNDRDYQRYGVGLEWRLSRKWSIRGDYAHRNQEFNVSPENASSNEASISFVYDPARRR